MKTLVRVIVIALSVACSGCFVVQVERPIGAAEARYTRQHFFLFGRIGEFDVDLARECPEGVASFGDRFTFSDALIGLLTVGIYTPRSVVIRCSVGGGGS